MAAIYLPTVKRPKGVVIGKLWQPGHRIVSNGGVYWETGRTGADMSSDELRLQKALLEKKR